MTHKIDMKSIPKDMGANDFNIYLKNFPCVIISPFTEDVTLSWKGQESIYTFKFNEIPRTDLLLFTLLSGKTGMDILGFDRKLI